MKDYNKRSASLKEKQFVRNLLNMQPNDISLQYFSNENLDLINNQLIDFVLIETKRLYGTPVKIIPQKKEILLSAMKGIYFLHGSNTMDTDKEVEYLNGIFLTSAVPIIISNIDSKMKYIKDITENVEPLSLPVNTRRRNILRNNRFTY